MPSTQTLMVACLPMIAGAQVAENAKRIEAGLRAAAADGARVLLTPECALCAYPPLGRADLHDLDAEDLCAWEERLTKLADSLGMVLILGTVSPAEGAQERAYAQWSNDALAVGAGIEPQRYRKRCLTPLDQARFCAGEDVVLVDIDGWRCGLSICFDVRFPDVWADLICAGADAVLHIAHMAGRDPEPGVKTEVIRQHYTSRAAEWATPLVCCNTGAVDRWLDSRWIDARGLVRARTATTLQCHALGHRDTLPDWYRAIYHQARARAEARR